MHVKQAAERAGFAAGAAGVVLAASVITSTITGLTAQRDHYRAEAGRPRPTVTRTAPAPATEAPPRATPGTTAPQPRATVVAAAPPRATSGTGSNSSSGGGGVSSQARPGTVAPSGPSPAPPTTSCRGSVLAIQAGPLPRCALTVGGTR